MAILHRRNLFSPHPLVVRLLQHLQKWTHSGAEKPDRLPNTVPSLPKGSFDPAKWKTVNGGAVSIKRSSISSSAWTVLNVLQRNGYEAYLVGGCVRDLLLKKIPKDFDVITTASNKKIRELFRRCFIVGRRFPICQVYIKGLMIEVSSFNTSNANKGNICSDMLHDCNERDYLRWKNSMYRDFTINSLFFDPFSRIIYDYVDGMKDLKTSKVRTVIPARLSFQSDCARILRGLRICARLGLQLSEETATAMHEFSSSISTLGKDRLMMELNFMLAYGAAQPSLHLLHKFQLLNILLPIQAAYLTDQSRKQSSESSTMLMKLFSNLDKLLAADRPADCILWLGLLAFHLALVENPQDALVVCTFASVLYYQRFDKAIAFSREKAKVTVPFNPEILASSGNKSDELLQEETSRFASLVKDYTSTLTNVEDLEKSLRKHDPAMSIGPVLASKKMGIKLAEIFDVLGTNTAMYKKKRTCEINHELLKASDHSEIRFVLGKVIMDTMTEVIHSDNMALPQRGPRPLSELFG